MLDEQGNIKIIDLGLGNFYDLQTNQDVEDLKLLDTFCGSADYAAPELWEGSRYKGPEVDIWSLGVILYILTTGFLPFNDSARVMSISYRWPRTVKLSESLKHLVGRIFVPSERRINMLELIKHPWMNEGYEKSVEAIPESVSTIDEDVVKEIHNRFGFKISDIHNSVNLDIKNQYRMAYWTFKQRKDQSKPAPKRPKKKASGEATPPSSPRSKEKENSKSGDTQNENKCYIF